MLGELFTFDVNTPGSAHNKLLGHIKSSSINVQVVKQARICYCLFFIEIYETRGCDQECYDFMMIAIAGRIFTDGVLQPNMNPAIFATQILMKLTVSFV